MSDSLSLTLPKATTRTRVRRRRPKRPSGWQVFWAGYCVWCVTWAVHAALTGDMGDLIAQAAYLAAGWMCLTRRKEGMPLSWWFTATGVTALAVGLNAAGVIS